MLTDLLGGADSAPALALAGGDETVSYAQLRSLVAARRLDMGALEGRLVMLGIGTDLESIVDYLALVGAGATVLLLDPRTSAERCAALALAYDPDAVVAVPSHGGWSQVPHAGKAQQRLEERVLLGTSGSTGSPKYVRLSEGNLLANADQIVEASGLTPDDRGLLSLPLHYSFGLSVLHSHLRAGASLAVSDLPWTSPHFGGLAGAAGVTGLFAVPYSMSILRRTGVLDVGIPGLRTVTVAGGRLSVDETLHAHERLASHGTDLLIRYGATEASAAISVLPPRELPEQAGSAGYLVAGLSAAIEPGSADGFGALRVEGPSVMLGYAHGRGDLGVGTVTGGRFTTSDLARIDPAGRLWIRGREGNFAKVRGLRVSLDDVESTLGGWGLSGRCVAFGLEEEVVVAVEASVDLIPSAREVERAAGLPPRCVRIEQVDALERTPAGKVDRAAARARFGADAPALRSEGMQGSTVRKAPHE